jgi:hypothetical protein
LAGPVISNTYPGIFTAWLFPMDAFVTSCKTIAISEPCYTMHCRPADQHSSSRLKEQG